jgi:hypothetical protein
MTDSRLRRGDCGPGEAGCADRGIPAWARIVLVCIVVAAAAGFVEPALADVGQTFNATSSCDGMVIPTGVSSGPAYTFPSSGTVTTWSTSAVSAGNEMEAVVWRPNGTNSFALVGSSSPQVPTGSGVKTYSMNVTVEAGDILGAWIETRDGVHNVADTCVHSSGDTGDWWRLSPPFPSSTPASGACNGTNLCLDSGFRYNISASYSGGVSTPQTSIDSSPASAAASTSAAFTFSSDQAGTFECSLDSAAFAACTSPRSYTNLAQGSHTFQVRATNTSNVTDSTPASFTWTVDTVAPQTSISNHPATATSDTDASFTFDANETATFECKLDASAFSSCTSPMSYSGLGGGSHTFAVRAVDAAGNSDASPATYSWTIAAVSTGGSGGKGGGSGSNNNPTTSASSGTFTVDGGQSGSVGILGGADTMSWPGGAFPGVHTIQFGVAPSPPLTGFAAGGVVLSLVLTDAMGKRTTSFPLPLVLHLKSPGTGITPAYFDGTSWHLIPRLTALPLPAAQTDGYVLNADGSLNIYTHHATLFGALTHTTGTTPDAFSYAYKAGATTFTFHWDAPAFGGVVGYRLILGTKILYEGKTTSAVVPACTGTFSLVVLYAGSQFVPGDTLTIGLKLRPKFAPRQIPAWAYRLYSWEHLGKKGARPKTAPVTLPKWYAYWRAWRLRPYRIAPER